MNSWNRNAFIWKMACKMEIAENMNEKKVYSEQLVTLSNALVFQWCKTVRWKCEWSMFFFVPSAKLPVLMDGFLKSGLEALWCLMHTIRMKMIFNVISKWIVHIHTFGEWCAISCGTKGITIFHLYTQILWIILRSAMEMWHLTLVAISIFNLMPVTKTALYSCTEFLIDI